MHRPLIDTHQNFWQLASIQVASNGLPGMIIGWQVANEYGTGNAIGAICIGNLILWLVGLVVISMSARYRTNAITNVWQHMGKSSAYFAAICFFLVALFWYSLQIKYSINAIDSVLQIHRYGIDSRSMRIGAAIGIWTSLLAIGGIRMIKWLNVICLPIYILVQLFLMFYSNHPHIEEFWGISFPAITTIVMYTILAMTVLPTFFRHSRSLADSFLALTILTILNLFFQISSIWIGFNELLPIFQNSNVVMLFLITTFLVLITICNLLLNIYSASASWESTLPKLGGPKEYAIFGLLGTSTYLFIQISPPMIFLKDLVTDYFAILSIALLITYLTQFAVKRRPITVGKTIGNASLLIGCITATILNITNSSPNTNHLLIAIGTCILFFIFTIFFEETIWSLRNLFRNKSNSSHND